MEFFIVLAFLIIGGNNDDSTFQEQEYPSRIIYIKKSKEKIIYSEAYRENK